MHKKIVIGLGSLFLLGIILTGFWATEYVTRSIKKNELHNLLVRTQTLGLVVNKDDLESLKGNLDDLKIPAYIRIKEKLTDVRDVNKDTRFVYIMGLKNEKQFFYVDSEDPSSKDYSPPGQVYESALSSDIYNHKKGISYIKGPYTDAWGNWFSAFAPVFGKDKEVLGMIAMDIKSEDLLLRISIVRWTSILITGLIFFSLLLLFFFALKSFPKTK